MEVILDSSELDDLIQKSVREHFTEVLSSVVCPVHDAALETIHIEGDSLDSLQMRIEGCCDEAMAAATQAPDKTEEEDAGEDDLLPDQSLQEPDVERKLRAV